jgi:hypothetical protein
MSDVTYCRVKWTIGGLTKEDINEYTGSTSTQNFTILIGGQYVPGW